MNTSVSMRPADPTPPRDPSSSAPGLADRAAEVFGQHAPRLLRGEGAVIGVSGGLDSMVLLETVHRIRVRLSGSAGNAGPFPDLVVHVNYGLRGADADRDQELVEQVCGMWGFECASFRLDPAEGRASGVNLQDWARRQRYAMFAGLARAEDLGVVLTAHHADDQVETILMRILRGAGMGAWAGMPMARPLRGEEDGADDAEDPAAGDSAPDHARAKAVSGGPDQATAAGAALDAPLLVRPFLDTPRQELIRHAEQAHIPYRLDATNEESEYARNLLRNRWTPRFDRLYPGWRRHVLTIRRRAEEFEELTRLALRDVVIEDPDGSGALDREGWLALPDAAARAVLHAWCVSAGATPGAALLEEARDRLGGLQTGGAVSLSAGVELVRDRDRFRILRADGPASDSSAPEEADRRFGEGIERILPVRFHLPPSGAEIRLETAGGTFSVRRFDQPPGAPRPTRSLIMDAETLLRMIREAGGGGVELRPWRAGDRFRPYGMAEGTQLVSDFLTNRKVPVRERRQALVLAVAAPESVGDAEGVAGVIAAVLAPLPGSARPGEIDHRCRVEPGALGKDVILIEAL